MPRGELLLWLLRAGEGAMSATLGMWLSCCESVMLERRRETSFDGLRRGGVE